MMADCTGSAVGSVKRSFSETELSSDDEETPNSAKPKKLKLNIKTKRKVTIDSSVTTGLKTETSEATVSQYADSAYDPSVGKSPCSLAPLKSVQPSSSGYTSDRSEIFSPRALLFSPDARNWENKFGELRHPQHLKAFLRNNFSKLKDEICPCGIADIICSHGLISSKDIELIDVEKSRREQCDLLIKAICKSTEIESIPAACKVLKAFDDEDYGYLLKYSPRKDQDVVPVHPDWTSKDIKGIFYVYGRQLEDELSPLDIIDHLVDVNVLNPDEHQNIKDISFKPKKVKYLCKYILRKEVEKFWLFCKVLDDHNYSALADLLRQKGKNLADPVTIVQTRKETVTVTAAHLYRSSDSDSDSDEDGTHVKLEFGEDGKVQEKTVVNNYDGDKDVGIQQEVMELGYRISKMKFSSVRINLTSLCRQSRMYLIKKCQESPKFLENWIKHLLSDTIIKQLKDKGTDTVTFEIKIHLPHLEEDQMECACKITKEWIVTHFSVLLEELKKMENVKQLIGKFAAFQGFDPNTRAEFDNITGLDDPEGAEKFLYMLLDLPDGDAHLCLLERELRASDHAHLIERLSDKDVGHTASAVTVKDIRGNLALLLDEIEPRRFVDMLQVMRNSDDIIERVTSTAPRKERCRDFLSFIIKGGDNAVSRFIPELKRHGKQHLIEALSAKQTTIHDEVKIKEALIAKHCEIIDEIEPRNLRQTFVDRRLIKAKEFDAICKLTSRRARANQLLLHVLEQNTVVLYCLIDAMQVAGYRQLVNRIKQEMEKYTECPRLFKVCMKGKKSIKFKGKYTIDFESAFMAESPLQVYLHKLVYFGEERLDLLDYSAKSLVPSNDFEMENIRQERTKKWIQNLELDKSNKRKSEEPISSTDDESCKRHCKETDWAVRGNVQSPPTAWPDDDKYDICSSTIGYPSEQSSRCGSPSRLILCSADSGIQLSSQRKACMSALSTTHPGNDHCNTSVSYPSVFSLKSVSPSRLSPSSADSGFHSNATKRNKKLKTKLLRQVSVPDDSCRYSCVSTPSFPHMIDTSVCEIFRSDTCSSKILKGDSGASKPIKGAYYEYKPIKNDSLTSKSKSDCGASQPLQNETYAESDNCVSKTVKIANSTHKPPKSIKKPIKKDSRLSKCGSSASNPIRCENPVSKPTKCDSPISKPIKCDSPVSKPIECDRPVSKSTKCDSTVSKSTKCDSTALKPTKYDGPVSKSTKCDSPVSKPTTCDSTAPKPIKCDGPVSKSTTCDSPVSKPTKCDSTAPKPIKCDGPVSKPIKCDSPVSKPTSCDSPVSKSTKCDSTAPKPIKCDVPVSKSIKCDNHVSKHIKYDSPVSKPIKSDGSFSKSIKGDESKSKPVKSDWCVYKGKGRAPKTIPSDSCVSTPLKNKRCTAKSSKRNARTSKPIKSDSCLADQLTEGTSRQCKIDEAESSQSDVVNDVVKSCVGCLSDTIEKSDELRSSNISNFFSSFMNQRAPATSILRTVNLMFSMLQIGFGKK